MIWVEMSKDLEHGGGSWGFSKCLWSPTNKNSTNNQLRKSPYWENLLKVTYGDIVIHLRGNGRAAEFVGYSIAVSDGFETTNKPPNPRQWSNANRFYKVMLGDFHKFSTPIHLYTLFSEKESDLKYYFYINKDKPNKEKKTLFYVIQNDRLQCQNGAYLSEVDDQLLNIIIGHTINELIYENKKTSQINLSEKVATNESVQSVKIRHGQNKFSKNVRANYYNTCCFPDCNVSEGKLLVGSHIARWADVPILRGELSNGICFCLIHDKAFELGFFTIDQNHRITINQQSQQIQDRKWFIENIAPYNGIKIKSGLMMPSKSALFHHWERIGYNPN